ncbi:MAG TPA: DUF4124 domain-containing protein [Gammaproteobacteria bacterium]
MMITRMRSGTRRCLYAMFAALLLTAPDPTPAREIIYKTTDENGEITYTNIPLDDAEAEKIEIVDMPEISIIPASRVSEFAGMSDPMRPADYQEESPFFSETENGNGNFYTLSIAQPEHNTAVPITGAAVQVELAVEPPLDVAAGHRIEILVDGAISTKTRETSLSLPGLDRGAHQLQARIVNDQNEVVQTTNTVTFFALQPTVFPHSSAR